MKNQFSRSQAMTEYKRKDIRYHGVLLIKTFSLIIIYAVYGLLQERIIKGHYPPITNKYGNTEFRSAPLLIFCNRVISFIAGIILSQLQPTNALHSLLPHVSRPLSHSGTPSSFPAKVKFLIDRIRPASPFFFYALVAGLNNAATLSQYASLSYLSFTTSTLGKSAKMVPVLIIGRVWYSKRYKCRQWIGAALVILGIWGYLSSLPKVDSTGQLEWKAANKTWLGILCLLAYLFFDGRTSTLQERLFGDVNTKREGTSTLMGITSVVIDQMVN
jgi:drug/metabolite transporter (DMT)-like permease